MKQEATNEVKPETVTQAKQEEEELEEGELMESSEEEGEQAEEKKPNSNTINCCSQPDGCLVLLR